MTTRTWCLVTLACLLAFIAGAFVGSCTDSVAMFWKAAYFMAHAERLELMEKAK
ncbi:MAG: hypothetical protein PHO67_08230 [Candidatus Omnitrophica bacterium]|nr:hypothetical protein [Candidatus Omnitrophota bacterium]